MYIYISLLSVLVVAFAKIYIVTPCHVIAVGGLCPKSRGFGGIFSVQRNLNLLATLQCFARFAPKHPKYVYIYILYILRKTSMFYKAVEKYEKQHSKS